MSITSAGRDSQYRSVHGSGHDLYGRAFLFTRRYSEDKILTKTMINNYTKNNLLPPSVKKKYSREHMLLLILIYYFKNILSIRDIETVLKPLREKYFSGENAVLLTDLYKEICEMEKTRIEPMKASVREAYEKSQSAFADIEDKDAQDELKLFAFICSLSFDVYLKKMMIEKIIVKLAAEPTSQNSHTKTAGIIRLFFTAYLLFFYFESSLPIRSKTMS